jgi:hypothetical protein
MKKFIIIYEDLFEELRLLDSAQLTLLMHALINEKSDGAPIRLDPVCALLFRLITKIYALEDINNVG